MLLRRTKNNPVLIGDPGVGKTAVAEGIAQLIASSAAPPGLAGRSLIALDVGSLVAGTQYRGAFEERLTVRWGFGVAAKWSCKSGLVRGGQGACQTGLWAHESVPACPPACLTACPAVCVLPVKAQKLVMGSTLLCTLHCFALSQSPSTLPTALSPQPVPA